MTRTMHGKVHGKTIELDEDLGINGLLREHGRLLQLDDAACALRDAQEERRRRQD